MISKVPNVQSLCAGDTVEVLGLPEVRATLDAEGACDGLPFMPEMVRHCGQRFRVAKRAHKTCDTLHGVGALRVRTSAVHLEGLRCDGSAHGGCEASCFLFWSASWLRRVPGGAVASPEVAAPRAVPAAELPVSWTLRAGTSGAAERPRYRCQATEVPGFTQALPYWDPRQYVQDWMSGNVTLQEMLWGMFHSLYRALLGLGVGYRYVVRAYNWLQRRRGGPLNPYVSGVLKSTPIAKLDLAPGDIVRIRSLDEIVATLDVRNRNRGLWFAPEELGQFCGKRATVAKRVTRLINERTGEMIETKTPSVILDGVNCTGSAVDKRLFCPRASALFWREIWLDRVEQAASTDETHAAAGCRDAESSSR